MQQTRYDLRRLDLERLEELRRIRTDNYAERYNLFFWDELSHILTSKDYCLRGNIWERMTGEFVLGNVWSQPIGKVYHQYSVHKFEYLYTDTLGLAICSHGHEQPVNGEKQILKISERYVFPDGRIFWCPKGDQHELINDTGNPLYVISVKIGGRSMI